MSYIQERTASGSRLFIPRLRAAAGIRSAQERFRVGTGRLYAFGIVVKGSAEIIMDGNRQIIRARSAFLLPPGSLAHGRVLGNQPLQYRVLLFHCVELAGRGSSWHAGPARLPAAIGPALATGAAALFDALKVQDRHTVCFLLARLLQRYHADLSEQSARDGGIEAAAAYMDKHFTESLQVEQLAGIAGYSPNHFTKLFKSAMDCTPIAYLTKLRIERAKQLMLTSGSMKEVASEVGYRDEHYFSRVFKQVTGVAPTIYIKTCHRRVAALYYGLDECLQTLGLQPVASLSYTRRIAHPVLRDGTSPAIEPQQTLRLDSIGMDYEALLNSRPELLITSDRLVDEAARMREIAPVALLKHSHDCTVMIRQVARLVGRDREAERWIGRFSELRSRVGERIAAQLGSATACFLRIMPSGYRLYGPHSQTGALLYSDLGLSLPGGLEPERWAIELDRHKLMQLQPDHLFVMVDPMPESGRRLRELTHSEQWREWRPVKSGCIYRADDYLYAALGTTGRVSTIRHAADRLGVDVRGIVQAYLEEISIAR